MTQRQAAIPPEVYECGTRRQHFNHLRNSSSNMRNILSWGGTEEILDKTQHDQYHHHPKSSIHDKIIEEDTANKQKKNVSFDNTHHAANPTHNPNTSPSHSPNKKPSQTPVTSAKAQDRPRSASTANRKTKD